jgi:hypothetical protein
VTGYHRKEGNSCRFRTRTTLHIRAEDFYPPPKIYLRIRQLYSKVNPLTPQLAEMTRPRLGNYGLGLQIVDLNGRTAYNHTGGIDGFSSHLRYYPRDVTVIVLANTEDEPVKKIATDIAGFALRH